VPPRLSSELGRTRNRGDRKTEREELNCHASSRLSNDQVIKELDLENSCTGCDSLGESQICIGRTHEVRGVVDRAALDALIDTYEHKVGPRNGARVISRAWVDPAYKQRLLTDATAAIAELGYSGHQGEHMVVGKNTPKLYNLVVCTLCSCYPWPVLGSLPVWYKSVPYRSRAVIDPRGVLSQFGLQLADDVEVRVWDSTAELRYLVLPARPTASEVLSEEALAALVTRDAMITSEQLTCNQQVTGSIPVAGSRDKSALENDLSSIR
jgi:nitrile hydratase